MALPHYAELFRTESGEQIATINHLLLLLEADPSQGEAIEGIFRAVHTLKGAAATVGYTGVAELAHELEGVLERLRRQSLIADAALIEMLLEAVDALEVGIERYAREPDTAWAAEKILPRLREYSRTDGASAGALQVRLQVDAAAAMPAARAYMALRRARELGVVRDPSPDEEALQDASFNGLLSFRLVTGAGSETVRSHLLAIGELVSVDVTPAAADARNGKAVGPGRVEPRSAEGPKDGSFRGKRHVRVDAERLDGLVEKLGELVILRDRLLRATPRKSNPELAEPVDQLTRLVGELRDEMLELRLVRIGEIFERFPRLVRDAARGLEKQVELVMEGQDLEVDRSLLDGLSEPLIHLLRNAVDHGIELPAERLARGKSAAGRVHLSAHRQRDRLWIRVEDDGRGIDRARVLGRARELGLMPEGQREVADEELFRVLTLPGFSTAERVTNVSGRGVGMDVVATQIRRLAGVLEVTSREGEGTRFTLKLPATVGMLNALLVRAAGETYAIPVAHVAETLELGAGDIHELGGQRVVVLRDEVVPLISLPAVLGGVANAEPRGPVAVVVLEVDDDCIGAEVDLLLSHQEVVIKPFDAPRELLPLFSGATILANGHPALLLDAAALCRLNTASVSAQRSDHVTITVRS